MKRFTLLALCSMMSVGLFAETNIVPPNTSDSVTTTAPTPKRYTFGDFFDALDLPCVFGLAVNNCKLEKPGMITAFRLGWRQHKSYGWCTFITYDFHIHEYTNTILDDSNIRNGEITYNEVGWSVGYRVPIVRDIKAFYQSPRLNTVDFYCTMEPVVCFVNTKHVEPVEGTDGKAFSVINDPAYTIPSGRITAGFEFFVAHNLSLYLETSIMQHIKPTNLEQAAIQAGQLKGPGRQGTIQAGLSMFFK